MAEPLKIDSELRTWATVRQLEYLDALEVHGSARKAGTALGMNATTIQKSMQALKRKAASMGYSPEHAMTRTVPDGYMVKGVSTYYNAEGKPSAQWVKSAIDQDRMAEIMQEAMQAFVEGVAPINAKAGPKDYSTDIIPWIQIGDAHLGLLTHSAEVGENFDLKIGERELCGAIGMLLDEMPNCERMVVNDLGDGTHYENFSATTAASGHPLDFDTRFPKMIRVYSRVMRFIIDKALEKAHHVDVIVNQGNHSRVNDIWIAELLRVAYGHTGRVHILNNDSVFIAYRMGNTLVMTHHSDKCKPSQLAHVMSTDFAKDWGETTFRYVDIGHVHHNMVLKEHPGVFIESFNHLAAMDRWAHDSGYRNRKSITVVLRSKTYGEIGRRLLPIQEIRDRLLNAKQTAPAEREVYTV
jgi:hypothetical protein